MRNSKSSGAALRPRAAAYRHIGALFLFAGSLSGGSAAALASDADHMVERMIHTATTGNYERAVGYAETNTRFEARRSQAEGDDETPRRIRVSASPSRADGDDQSRRRQRSAGTRVASLGPAYGPVYTEPKPTLSGGGNIKWVASAGCLDSRLVAVIHHVAQNYGSVTVNSTCRNHAHNRRVGGAPKSYHLTGSAADFRVHGNHGAAYSYLKGAVGGLSHYGGGLFHIDTGPRRPM